MLGAATLDEHVLLRDMHLPFPDRKVRFFFFFFVLLNSLFLSSRKLNRSYSSGRTGPSDAARTELVVREAHHDHWSVRTVLGLEWNL